jgi:hypothetical protein
MFDRPASRIAVGGIVLLGLINLVRGSIHLFAPDGGLTDIAGIDLSQGRDIILFFIGAVGVGQLTLGLVDLAVAWRFRGMVLPLLVIHMVGSCLGLFLFFVQRPLPVTPPGQYGAVVSFVVFGLITLREFVLNPVHDDGRNT